MGDLMRSQFKFKTGIFGCEGWEAFSDGDFCLDEAKTQCVTKMPNAEGEFSALTRMDKPEKYVNAPLFYQVWKALRDHGNYQHHDWTIKVDPQTVFLPQRLRDLVSDKTKFKDVQTEQGNYFENCPGVLSGMFGNIEVTNLKAFTVFMTGLEDCKLTLCWRNTDDCKKDWNYGPWVKISSCRSAWTRTACRSSRASSSRRAAPARSSGQRQRRRTRITCRHVVQV